MPSRASLGAFAFPSPRGCRAPSLLSEELARLTRIASLLSGALLVSLLAGIVLAQLAAARADVVAYVADGGVFGCKVKLSGSPQTATTHQAHSAP